MPSTTRPETRRRGPRRPSTAALLIAACVAASPSASAQTIRTHLGGGDNHFLGSDVAFVGDLDADGRDDYAVLGRDASLGPNPPWLVVRSGATGGVLATLGVNSGAGPLGNPMRVGDVDGDGSLDLGVASAGTIGVLSMAADTYVWQASLATTPTGGTLKGSAAVGDIDGDGVCDLASVSSTVPFGDGETEIFSGATGARIWVAPIAGTSVARIGDANGDGFDDLLVGDENYTVHTVAAYLGRALVLDGTDGSVIRIHRTDPISTGQRYGSAVCRLDDVDGDAVDDIAVAAGATDRANTYPAWIDIWSGATGTHVRRIERVNENGLGGRQGTLMGAGDLDGDGRGDLLVGMRAEYLLVTRVDYVYAYSGGTGAVLAMFDSAGGAGHDLDFGGDVDGDGSPDLIFGAPYFSDDFEPDEWRQGRVVVTRLTPSLDGVVRFCPQGANSTGSPGRIDWTGSNSVAQANYGLSVSDVPPNTFGLFVMHDSLWWVVPVGNGTLCIDGAHRLSPIVATGAGSAALPLTPQQLRYVPWSPVAPGDIRAFQFWSRDTVGAGSNLSDAVLVSFVE